MKSKKQIITIYNLWDTIFCCLMTIIILLFWFLFLWPNLIKEDVSVQFMIFLSCIYLPIMPGLFVGVIVDRPITIIWFNSNEILFFRLFRKTIRGDFLNIATVKKAFFYYMRLYNQVSVKEYLECIEIHVQTKYNNEKIGIIPYKYIFRGSKDATKKRLKNLFQLIDNLNSSIIERDLVEDLSQKKDDYLSNKKIKKKIMYVQSDSSFEIIEK